jgi:hypothetical protein
MKEVNATFNKLFDTNNVQFYVDIINKMFEDEFPQMSTIGK